MKCNPVRWLWGLLPVALLSWVAVQVMHADIEADLKTRVDEQFNGSGFKWIRTGFSGRDGLITGTATDEADPGRAYDIARSIWGVRVVENRAAVIDKVDAYEWSVARSANTVKLAGFVPNENVRADIVKLAKSRFAGAVVVDEMKLARGVPSPDAWLSAVNFGIKQVAGLTSGEARLSGLALTVSGTAGDLQSYNGVKSALATELPKGIKLVDDRVVPPVVKPFTWTATHRSGQLVLGGYVASERARAETLAAAKATFPRVTVVDRMQLAEGAAPGIAQAVLVTLKQLATLEDGVGEIRDEKVSLQGLAADALVAEAARQGLAKGMAAGFLTSDAIKVREAVVKPVSPYTTLIAADAAAVVLSGYAPSDAAREQLGQSVRGRFPGRRVDNRLEVAPGAPDGWMRCFDGAMSGVARLGAGRMALTNRRLEVAGASDDEALAGALPSEIKSAVQADCEATVQIDVLAEAVPDLVWRALYSGNDIVLEGDVSSAAAKSLLAASASRLFPGKSVVDRTRIVDTRTRKWASVAEQGLISLADLQKGEANLVRQRLSVSGQAVSAAQVTRVQDRLSRTLPQGYSGTEQITVASAAAPPGAAPPAAPTSPPPLSAVAVACQTALISTAREGMLRFERASANLTRESFPTLNKLATVVKTCPDVTVEIEGHTDSEGTPERNQSLSDRRAQAVVAYLLRGGVDTAKLAAVGYGETRPLVPNDTPENRAKNRRIEFIVKGK